jgi:ketosteroid isomerase-like protein
VKRLLATILTVTLMTPTLAFADGHLDSEKSVKEAIQQYWDARNNRDHETVAAMESDSGMYGTNSDGSFHKPVAKATADDWKRNMVGDASNMRIAYTEAAEVADGVVYARYYAEGVVGTADNQTPYRTRVTNVWVKEADGKWRAKAMHFSRANYGGTHQTVSSDFDD